MRIIEIIKKYINIYVEDKIVYGKYRSFNIEKEMEKLEKMLKDL